MSNWWQPKNWGQALHDADAYLRKIGMPDVYIGVKSTNDGKNFEPVVNVGYSSPGNPTTSSKPAAYSRTTAAKATDIAQGGMTKDEVEDFNKRHPNETANTRG